MGKRKTKKKEQTQEDEEFFITSVPGQPPDKGPSDNEKVEEELDALEEMAADPDSIEGLMDQLVEDVKSAYPEPDAPIVTDGAIYDARKDTYDDEIVLNILNELENEVAKEDASPATEEARESVSLTNSHPSDLGSESGFMPDENQTSHNQGKGFTNGTGRTNGFTNGLGRTNGLTNGSGRGRTNGLTNGSGRGRTNGLTNGVRGRTNGLTNGTGRTNGFTNGRGRTTE